MTHFHFLRRQEVKKKKRKQQSEHFLVLETKRSIVILWSRIWQMVDVTTSVKLWWKSASRGCYSNPKFNWNQLPVAGQPQTVRKIQRDTSSIVGYGIGIFFTVWKTQNSGSLILQKADVLQTLFYRDLFHPVCCVCLYNPFLFCLFYANCFPWIWPQWNHVDLFSRDKQWQWWAVFKNRLSLLSRWLMPCQYIVHD